MAPLLWEPGQELQSFRAEQDLRTGHVSYEAYSEQDHDDLVYALAMIAWWGETRGNRFARMMDGW